MLNLLINWCREGSIHLSLRDKMLALECYGGPGELSAVHSGWRHILRPEWVMSLKIVKQTSITDAPAGRRGGQGVVTRAL